MSGIEAVVSLDIDGTQYVYGDSKHDEESMRLKNTLEGMREDGRILIVHNTGRPFPWVCHGEPVPRYLNPIIAEPDFLISHAGTVVWDDYKKNHQLESWRKSVLDVVSKEEVQSFLNLVDQEGFVIDQESFGNEFKICVKSSPEHHADTVESIKDMAENYFPQKFDVMYWNNTSVDITPRDINKRTALEHLVKAQGLVNVPIIVGGDSMNDSPLLTHVPFQKIVVGNANQELKERTHGIAGVFYASAEKVAAAGVLDGLKHFGLLKKSDVGVNNFIP